MTSKCGNCGSLLDSGKIRCPNCGSFSRKPVSKSSAKAPNPPKQKTAKLPATECGYCGHAISPNAIACPSCGEPTARQPAAKGPADVDRKYFILGGIVLGGLLLLIGYLLPWAAYKEGGGGPNGAGGAAIVALAIIAIALVALRYGRLRVVSWSVIGLAGIALIFGIFRMNYLGRTLSPSAPTTPGVHYVESAYNIGPGLFLSIFALITIVAFTIWGIVYSKRGSDVK